MRFDWTAKSSKLLFSIALVCAFSALAVAQAPTTGPAEPPAPPPVVAIAPGDTAITGFSGVELAGGGRIPLGVNPLDKTILAASKATLKILDLSSIGAAPTGQLLPPTLKFAVPAKDIGQVFALAFDDGTNGGPPNVYAASTSIYGLHLVAEKPDMLGTPIRLKAGSKGARFMEGQFGLGATPGAIWKIDGTTGKASLFAETIENGIANSGAALGDIAIDPKTKSLYASDLDNGLIYRFPLAGGASGAAFDHGTTGRKAAGLTSVSDDKKRAEIGSPAFKSDDPKTWGITQPERRIDGLAVHDGRLYYAVAAGPEIWSVGIGTDGNLASDPRLETVVKAEKPAVVSDIAFDAQGRMIVALRGATESPYDYRKLVAAGQGPVLRFLPGKSPARWSTEPESYAVGAKSGNGTGTGGIALGYPFNNDGAIDLATCSGTLAATGDALPVTGGQIVNGAQIMAVDLVEPADALTRSAFIDFDPRQSNKELTGHVGDIEIFQRCDGSQIPGQTVAGADPGDGGGGGGFGGGGGSGPAALDEGFFTDEFVEEPGEDVAAEEGVDPNAPNIAVEKTQECKVEGAVGTCRYTVTIKNDRDVPFDLAGATIGDAFTGAPPTMDIPPLTGGATATGNGFSVPVDKSVVIPPRESTQSHAITVKFAVPKEGVKVENCAAVTLAAPGTVTGPATSPEEQEKFKAAQSPQIKSVVGPFKDDGVTPGCTDRDGIKGCSWRVTLQNPKTPFKGSKISTVFSEKPTTDIRTEMVLNGVPTGVPRTAGTDGQTFEATSDVPVGETVLSVTGTFPADRPVPGLTPSMVSLGTPDDPAAIKPAPTAGTASADSNPGDNQSCIAFDSKNPNDQGTPTNEPTLPGSGVGGEASNAPPPTGPPPSPFPQQPVEVSKRAEGPCTADGECSFSVVLKNNSDQPSGPISFNEAAFAFGADSVSTPVALVDAPNDPFKCQPPGEKGMACEHPGLEAGGTDTLKAKVKTTLDQNGEGAVQNCAQIADAASDIDPEILDSLRPGTLGSSDSLDVAAVPRTRTCPPNGPCLWDITVTNNTGVEKSGALEVSGGGAGVHSPTSSDRNLGVATSLSAASGEGLTCGAEHESACSIPNVTLKPGESKTITVTTTPTFPEGVSASVYRQMFLVDIPEADKKPMSGMNLVPVVLEPPIPGATPGPGVPEIKLPSAEQIASLAPMDCDVATTPPKPEGTPPPATTPPPAPPAENEPPDLVVTKLATGRKADGLTVCDVNEHCPFHIVVTNRGGTYKGKLTIEDRIDAPPVGGKPASISVVPGTVNAQGVEQNDRTDSRLTCLPRTDFNVSCKADFIEIKNGEFVNVIVEVQAGPSWKNPDTPVMFNCAHITFDNQPPDNGSPPKHRECESVKLDPFDVAVVKTGGQSCQPGKDCKFNLDIFNPGNIPHNDPVIVTDKLTGIGNAQIVSLTPVSANTRGVAKTPDPFPCNPQPTQAPFTCTGDMHLDVGEHNNYEVVIRIPEGAPTTGAFTNCASVVPDGGAARETVSTGPADGSCHSTALAPATPDQCPEGWTGTHPDCKPPEQLTGGPNSTQQPEEPAVGTLACPDGWTGIHPDCVPPQELTGGMNATVQPDQCFGGMIAVDGACRCPAPKEMDSATGECASPITIACPDDWVGEHPYCRPANTPTLTGGMNETQDDDDKTPPPRECPGNQLGTPPKCYCPKGTKLSGHNCVKIQTATPCPGDLIGKSPNCYCPDGLKRSGTSCIRPPTPCPGDLRGYIPNCSCPPGLKRKGFSCVKPKPPKCRGQMIGTPPNCYCAAGYTQKGFACVRVAAPPPKPPPAAAVPCPTGTVGTFQPNCRAVTGGTNSTQSPEVPKKTIKRIGKAKPCPAGTHREADGKCWANVN